MGTNILILMCGFIGGCIGTAIAYGYVNAKFEDDGIVRERELTISEYGIDKKGNRFVYVWARKAYYFPFLEPMQSMSK